MVRIISTSLCRWVRGPEQCPLQLIYPNMLQILPTHTNLSRNKRVWLVRQHESWSPRAQSVSCKISWQSLRSLCYMPPHWNLPCSCRLASCEILLWWNQIWRDEMTKGWPTSNSVFKWQWSTRTSWSLKRIFAAVFIYQLMRRTKMLSSSVESPLFFAVFHNNPSRSKL